MVKFTLHSVSTDQHVISQKPLISVYKIQTTSRLFVTASRVFWFPLWLNLQALQCCNTSLRFFQGRGVKSCQQCLGTAREVGGPVCEAQAWEPEFDPENPHIEPGCELCTCNPGPMHTLGRWRQTSPWDLLDSQLDLHGKIQTSDWLCVKKKTKTKTKTNTTWYKLNISLEDKFEGSNTNFSSNRLCFTNEKTKETEEFLGVGKERK